MQNGGKAIKLLALPYFYQIFWHFTCLNLYTLPPSRRFRTHQFKIPTDPLYYYEYSFCTYLIRIVTNVEWRESNKASCSSLLLVVPLCYCSFLAQLNKPRSHNSRLIVQCPRNTQLFSTVQCSPFLFQISNKKGQIRFTGVRNRV